MGNHYYIYGHYNGTMWKNNFYRMIHRIQYYYRIMDDNNKEILIMAYLCNSKDMNRTRRPFN